MDSKHATKFNSFLKLSQYQLPKLFRDTHCRYSNIFATEKFPDNSFLNEKILLTNKLFMIPHCLSECILGKLQIPKIFLIPNIFSTNFIRENVPKLSYYPLHILSHKLSADFSLLDLILKDLINILEKIKNSKLLLNLSGRKLCIV